MKRVFKYQIPVQDAPTRLELPVGATIVDVGVQHAGKICLWAEVPILTSEQTTRRYFAIVGTGHDVPHRGTHVGTVHNGPYVWHVYEVTA